MTRTNLPELRLIAYTETSRDYVVVKVTAVQEKDGSFGNIGDYSYEPRFGLIDLYARAQIDRSSPAFYGWELVYLDLYRLTARELEAKAKTMRQITNRLEKMDATLGTVSDFPSFLGRFAHVLGATSIGRLPQGAYNFRDVTWMTVDQTRYWLSGLIRDFVG